MKSPFEKYVINLYQNVPTSVYVSLMIVFFIGIVVLISLKGRKGWRYVLGLLLTEYIFLIYCSTVIFRETAESIKYAITPLWSYEAIQAGRDDLLRENIMNVLVFVPVGVLFGCTFRGCKWWMALLFGGILSLSVEVSQYVLNRGLAEFDDLFHNTMGCIIGFFIVVIIKEIWSLQKKYSMN